MPGPNRILVTGAAGFVGGHLLPALHAAYPAANLLTDPFDVTDEAAVQAAIRHGRPDAVIHLAAISATTTARAEPNLAWQVNLHGTLALARAVLTHAPQAVFLFAGSGDAYGATFRSGLPVTEAMPLAPMNIYGATKAAADLALGAMAAEGLRAIRARPFNHTGPGQTDTFAIPAFAHQVMRIEAGLQPPVMQVGALASERDFLDVRDVCTAYAACLGADLPPGQILNLASGHPRRIGDVLQALLDMAGVTAEIRTDTNRLRATEIPRALGDASEAKRLLDWEPRIPWTQTLADVLEDWRGRVATER